VGDIPYRGVNSGPRNPSVDSGNVFFAGDDLVEEWVDRITVWDTRAIDTWTAPSSHELQPVDVETFNFCGIADGIGFMVRYHGYIVLGVTGDRGLEVWTLEARCGDL